MHLMPTSEQLTLILETYISRHVCSYCVADSQQDCQISTAPQFLKTYILNSTRIPALGLLQGSNGVLQDLHLALLVKVLLLLPHRVIGIGDWLQSIIPSRNRQASTINETGLDPLRHHPDSQVLVRSNFDCIRNLIVIPRFGDHHLHRLPTIQIMLLKSRIRRLKDYRSQRLFSLSRQRQPALLIPIILPQTLASPPRRMAITVGRVLCRLTVEVTVLHPRLGPLPTTESLHPRLATLTSNINIIPISHTVEV